MELLMRILTASLFLSALSLGISCSDDTKAPGKEASVQMDKGSATPDKGGVALDKGSVSSDKGGSAKEGGQTDSSSGPWTCHQIYVCQEGCGLDLTCIYTTCPGKGCQSAKDKNKAVVDCAVLNCTAACLTGFNATCEACVRSKCPTQVTDCDNNKC
jgi:hypothetical protein